MPAMRNTIKKHIHFLPGPDDITACSTFFFIRARATKFTDGARYGITATKRTFKLAVNRNRAKRLLRDWIRFCETKLCPDLDYIFIARHGILEATRAQGRTALKKALHHIKKLNDTKNANN